MKQLLLGLGLIVFLAGCGKEADQSAPTPAPSVNNPLTTAIKAQQNMVKTVDLTTLTRGIEMFQVQEGRLPKDLNELVAKKYVPALPEPPAGSKFVYDAAKGTVTIEKL